MEEDALMTVSEVIDLVKSSLTTEKLRVIGEVCQPKLSQGHLYFGLKEGSDNLQSIIWKNTREILREKIVDGQKITVVGRLNLYGARGSLSFVVDQLVDTSGAGEIHLEYQRIRQDFENRGYFDKDRKKKLPPVLRSVVVFTSEGGAAVRDFIHTLRSKGCRITCQIMDVPVQGAGCPFQICAALTKKNFPPCDLIVITRGGGSLADLIGFSKPELVEAVYGFTDGPPVLSAVGHERDVSLLDLVADVSMPTPSMAAQLIVDHNRSYLQGLFSIKRKVQQSLLRAVEPLQTQLNTARGKIRAIVAELAATKRDIKGRLISQINARSSQLAIIEAKIQRTEDGIVLVGLDGRVLKDPSELMCEEELSLWWGAHEFKVIIKAV